MEVSTLRMFVEVMRLGSIAAVAWDRGIAPSSVSRAIAALESELGARLFQRTAGALTPTEAGTQYYQRIEPVIDELEAARLTVQGAGDSLIGTVRLVAPPTFAQMNLVPYIPNIAREHPRLGVELTLTDSFVDLRADRFDLGIRLGGLPEPSYVSRRLCHLKSVACATPEYLALHGRPRSPVGLADHDCLRLLNGYDGGARWRFRSKNAGIQEVPVHGRFAMSDVVALRQLALAGLGPALLPRWVVAQNLRAGSLVDLFPNHEASATDFDDAAWVIYPSKRYLSLKVQGVIAWIEQAFQTGAPSERSASHLEQAPVH